MDPEIESNADSKKGRVPTPHGDVTVEWPIDESGAMSLKAESPEEVSLRRSSLWESLPQGLSLKAKNI